MGSLDRTGRRAQARTKSRQPEIDHELDEALEHTFPASDPVSVGHPTGTEPPLRPTDRKAPLIDAADVAEARKSRANPGR